jgi:MFS family permease
VQRYDKMLHALGLEDHELDRRADLGSPWRPLALVAQAVGVYLLLPPLLVLGYAVNYPVALILGALARRLGAKVKDEASLKLLLGAGVFPLVWLAVSLLVAWGEINLHQLFREVPEAPWLAGVATFLLCSVGGLAAVRYTRLAAETYRALRVRLTRARRRRTVARLARERAAIYEAALALSEGLDLPGAVATDGRITAQAPEAH